MEIMKNSALSILLSFFIIFFPSVIFIVIINIAIFSSLVCRKHHADVGGGGVGKGKGIIVHR